jgi:hypothetical protein
MNFFESYKTKTAELLIFGVTQKGNTKLCELLTATKRLRKGAHLKNEQGERFELLEGIAEENTLQGVDLSQGWEKPKEILRKL